MPERRSIGMCPELGLLLLASEGGLPARQLVAVREHLRQCASCRERLGEAARLIDDFASDAIPLPAPTDASANPYDTFRERLRLESTLSSLARPVTASRWPSLSLRPWLPVAAAIPFVVVGLLLSDRYMSTVKADELLAQAVVQERAVPRATVRRVRIRLNTPIGRRPAVRAAAPGAAQPRRDDVPQAFPPTETVICDVGDSAFVEARALTPAEAVLAQLFAAHRFDLNDPINASHFQAWRSSLAHKRDVVGKRQGNTLLALQTTTDEGVLRRAELVVRQADYHPVRQTWLFEGFGEVEVVELASWVAELPRAAPKLPAAVPHRHALDDAELEARRALHAAAADLDAGVEIRRSARRVEVRGSVASGHGTDLRARLGAIDLVLPLLRSAPPGAPPVARPPTDTGLALWRARTFSRNPGVADAFLATLVQHVERLRARANAYDALAVRYSEPETQMLSPRSQKKLESLVEAHRRGLLDEIEEVDAQLGLLLGSTTRSRLEAGAADDWRGRAVQASAAATKLRDAVQRLVREEDLPSPTTPSGDREAPAAVGDVRRATDDLWHLFGTSGTP